MNEKQKAAPGTKTGAASQKRKANLTEKARYVLCRAIYPDGFFNLDASLEIDRLTIELEALRARVKLLEAAA